MTRRQKAGVREAVGVRPEAPDRWLEIWPLGFSSTNPSHNWSGERWLVALFCGRRSHLNSAVWHTFRPVSAISAEFAERQNRMEDLTENLSAQTEMQLITLTS